MSVREEVLASNRAYKATFGDKGNLGAPPVKRIAILTCMDARLDPAQFAGLIEGDAHIIRNAGGRATDDAIRSLVISHKMLGTLEWFVIHHTKCGMQMFSNEEMGELLSESLNTAKFENGKWVNSSQDGGSNAGRGMEWGVFSDLIQSVRDDVEIIRNHPLVPDYIKLHGFIYEVETGSLASVDYAFSGAESMSVDNSNHD